ncbi:tetratricopeptide repeat protein [Alkalibacillus silvisoli]|uniref:Tetratricopeptide repeat protein n=1 Tax=Alkalibacillus silvisoli TaxID=392823 RepID=A0ABP3JY39_9BACI
MDQLQEAIRLKNEGNLKEAQPLLAELANEHKEDQKVLLVAAEVHEKLELFPQAITFYQQALEFDLNEEYRKKALLHLGISYRAVGLYEQARETLEVGMSEFPSSNPFYIYFAMTLYNLGDSDLAMEIMAQKLIETTKDSELINHRGLIEFYASCLDETFN